MLIILLIVYVLFELSKPQEEDWSVTFHHESTAPFGSKALDELMKPVFNMEISYAYKSMLELLQEDSIHANQMIIANSIELNQEDTELILKEVKNGHTFFMSAFGFAGSLADTFGIQVDFQEVLGLMPAAEIEKALSGQAKRQITFNIDDHIGSIEYPAIGATNSFDSELPDSLEVLARNDEGRPVLIHYQNGGQLVLSTIPLAFTNYFTLLDETASFTEEQVLLIPRDEPLIRNHYYQLGRLESTTPLRVLLSNQALRWATFILLFGVLIYFIFQSKRTQRMIPVMTPLSNLTLEFVHTLGRLYYRQSNHVKLSAKRVLYWKEYIRTHYNLNTQELDQSFINELVNKSGKDENLIESLVRVAKQIEKGQGMANEQLLHFEKDLNEFYGIE